jgi:hypothetical protein
VTSSNDSQNVRVEGAKFIRSTVGGSVNAGVNVSVGSDRRSLPSAVEQLVRALEGEGLVADPALARLVGRLESAPDNPDAVRGLVDQIERHQALAGAIPGAVSAALQAIHLVLG